MADDARPASRERGTTRFLHMLTGCFSSPAGGNPTGAMVEAAYARHGIAGRYVNCDVAAEGLGDAVRGAVAMGWVGFNLSLPHKQTVIPYLDELGESAAVIGAVNCVVRRDGARLVGENTDGKGFLSSLRTVVEPKGRRVVILGAGGAARAIAVELALAGAADVTVVNRNRERAVEIVEAIGRATPTAARAVAWDEPYAVPAGTEILINATSVGLAPRVDERLNLRFETIGRDMVVSDVIMNPPQTHLLKTAADRGATVLDGRGMLVNQAALNLWHWTGVHADADVMRAALDAALEP